MIYLLLLVHLHHVYNNNDLIYIAPFHYIKTLLPIILPRQEITTINSLHLGRFAVGQAHAPSALGLQHSPQLTVPDTLWSMKQLRLSILPKDKKHAGRSGAWTHNIDGRVIWVMHFFGRQRTFMRLQILKIAKLSRKTRIWESHISMIS